VNGPALHVLAGPNGAGKSTLAAQVVQPTTGLPFINADEIAKLRWPGDEERHAYEASQAAADARDEAIATGESFITETVFSHPSKTDLIVQARAAGYFVELHVLLIREDQTVERVASRVRDGGHRVPEDKIRQRYRRLWSLVAAAVSLVDYATVYDNTSTRNPFNIVAEYDGGRPIGRPAWPAWTPSELTALGA
jgi:predicted ABC-type ATPase